ncbi:hypothetical protein L2E82_01815 [Cichorium intybus]|uniref:Uncharacterized protein n=1 Tax=Cichorium intybus TaxID=13427 RepID=A0ACB9GZY8_CICIN|nr:hypothetical protein L2E82_01815 [Cichorium intybus]
MFRVSSILRTGLDFLLTCSVSPMMICNAYQCTKNHHKASKVEAVATDALDDDCLQLVFVRLNNIIQFKAPKGMIGIGVGLLLLITVIKKGSVWKVKCLKAADERASSLFQKLYAGKDGELSVIGRLAAGASAGMTSIFVRLYLSFLFSDF